MPAHRTTMRRIKEVLRLKWACNLTHRQVQGALGVGLGTITQYLQLATAAGLDWAAAEPLEEDELERRILSPASSPAPAAYSGDRDHSFRRNVTAAHEMVLRD